MAHLHAQNKISWTENYKPYPCKIHDTGPTFEAELKDLEVQFCEQKLRGEDLAATTAKLKACNSHVQLFRLHLQQFEKCRPMVDRLMSDLKCDECLLFRDFVNQHNVQGSKVNNLVLVLIEKRDGVLLRSKISQICSDPESQSCDRDFVADVFEFHLDPKGNMGADFSKGLTPFISLGIMALIFQANIRFLTSHE